MDQKRRDKIIKYSDRVGSSMSPVSIQAGIIDDCYNECYMCSHHKRKNKKIISSEVWVEFLSMLPDLESVCYSGGDFMKHPDANNIMSYHIQRNLAFGMITSGFAPWNIDFKLLKQARWVRCSLDTINDFAYQKSRGGELTASQVCESILEMKAYGVNVELTITVHKHNSEYLNELFNWAWKNKISVDIHPIFGKEFTLSEHNIINRWENSFISSGLTFQPHQFNSYQFKKCHAVYYQCFIDSKGDIYPCCNAAGDTRASERMYALGNIEHWSDYLIDRNQFHKQQILPDFCKHCIDRFRSINNVCDSIRNKQSFF